MHGTYIARCKCKLFRAYTVNKIMKPKKKNTYEVENVKRLCQTKDVDGRTDNR